MNLSTTGKFKDTIFKTRLAVKRSISVLPLTFVGNMKAVPKIDADRTFFHAIGIVMVVATLATGAIMVFLATNMNESELQELPISGLQDGG